MVVETIHVMDANETTSEAFKNYAGAAFLVGMAVLCVGIGAGMISESIRKLRKPASTSNFTDDLLDKLRKSAGKSPAGNSTENVVESTIEDLKRTMSDILGSKGAVVDQVTSKETKYYYVKKSYKEEVKVGSAIPENFLVERPSTMTQEMFMGLENIKIKSKTALHIKGGVNLITVDEIVNSEPVKPV